MQSTPSSPSSPIPVPKVDTDEPTAVIPLASVAPLDGDPDGDRINTFALAPKDGEPSGTVAGADLHARVLGKPLTYLAAAFSLGFILARVLR